MIDLLVGGGQQMRPQSGVAREQGLPCVESLRADLAGMVDPHEACSMPPLGLGERRLIGDGVCGIRPRRRQALGSSEHQSLPDGGEQMVDRAQAEARLRGRHVHLSIRSAMDSSG